MVVFQNFSARLRLLWRSDSGATAIEYGMIAAFISVAVLLTIFSDIGNQLQTMLNGVNLGLVR